MPHRNVERVTVLVATALFVILSFLPALVPSHRLLFVLFFLYLVMTPGWLLSRRIVPWAGGFLRVVCSFAFGTALAFVILFILALAGADIRIVRIVIPAMVVFLSLWPPRVPDASEILPDHFPAMKSSVAPVLCAALIVIAGILILKTGDPLTYTSDSPDHIAYIRTISVTHQAFPDRFYYGESGALTRDIRKGMIHALWGAINSLTGSPDVAAIWPVIALIGSTFFILSLYCAAFVLFESAAMGLVAAILVVLYYEGGLAGYQLVYNASGYWFGKSFYVLAFAFIARYLIAPRPGYIAIVALSLLAATGTHIAHFAAASFMIVVFSISSLVTAPALERRELLARRIPCLFAAAILPNVPYLLLRYARDYAPNNSLHTRVQGVLFFTKTLYVMNPVVFFETAGCLGALALVSVFILWRRARFERTLMLLLHGTLAIYAVLFIPLWYPFLLGKMSYLLMRLEFAVPSMIVCAYLLAELWKKLRGRDPGFGTGRAVIGLAAAAIFLGYPLAKLPSGFAYGTCASNRLHAQSFRNVADLFEFMNGHCVPGSVVASDPITSFGIPAFTDDYVICPFDQHSIPNDSTAVERITNCRKIFRPGVSMTEIRRILDSYGAGYLVINGRIPSYVETMYWKPDRDGALALSGRIHGPTSPFRILYERDGITLAKLVAGPACTGVEREAEHVAGAGDSLDSQAASLLAPSGIAGIRIKEALPDRTEAAPGDTVGVDITWVAAEHCPLSSYVAYLRFETDFPKNVLYRESWGKPYRKIIEKAEGHRYRFRIDFQPFGGIVPPDDWPLLREMHDRVRVEIPRDVSPGTYTIFLKMADRPQYPNYVLRDILTDDDFYRGAAVTTIRVR
ncbi:MAG: hypothetical protein ABR899_06640 [Candidatus Krumholzibacteriaceae bacterium]